MVYKCPFFSLFLVHVLPIKISPNLILIIFPLHVFTEEMNYFALAYVPEYVHKKSMALFNTAMKQICVRMVQKEVSTLKIIFPIHVFCTFTEEVNYTLHLPIVTYLISVLRGDSPVNTIRARNGRASCVFRMSGN
jgi:hypothetical protein